MDIVHDYLDTLEVKEFDYDLVIKSPGIPYFNPIVKKLKKTKIISDIELIGCFLNRDMICVTGTNGKTSTVTLLNEILEHKYHSIACGNNGVSICNAALADKDLFVIEASSFQLCGVKKFHPKIAVILNLSPAHQDYHKSLSNYYESKMRMLKNQTQEEMVLYNGDDPLIKSLLVGDGKRISFGLSKENDYYCLGNKMYFKGKKIITFKKTNLVYSQMASIIIALIYHIPKRIIKRTIKTFKGLPYRNAQITERIFNDAKSTNPESTLYSLAMYQQVVLVCGGKNRGEDLSVLDRELTRISRVFAYGETRFKIENYFKEKGIEVTIKETLKEVLGLINLSKEETLLYSPMMASWDQYKNYMERGKEFNEFIMEIKKNEI